MNMLAITCEQLAPVVRIAGYLFNLVKIAIPLVLIALIIFDFTKAVLANDEKKMNEARQTVGKRLFYALVIFLVPTIVSILFRNVTTSIPNNGLSSATDWISCFKSVR